MLQIKCVDRFVNNVNSTLQQLQDHERLKDIIAKIESYDVVVSRGTRLVNAICFVYSLILNMGKDL
jgi:polysaccharide pyruvyl transferase WcaK-like protein